MTINNYAFLFLLLCGLLYIFEYNKKKADYVLSQARLVLPSPTQ